MPAGLDCGSTKCLTIQDIHTCIPINITWDLCLLDWIVDRLNVLQSSPYIHTHQHYMGPMPAGLDCGSSKGLACQDIHKYIPIYITWDLCPLDLIVDRQNVWQSKTYIHPHQIYMRSMPAGLDCGSSKRLAFQYIHTYIPIYMTWDLCLIDLILDRLSVWQSKKNTYKPF